MGIDLQHRLMERIGGRARARIHARGRPPDVRPVGTDGPATADRARHRPRAPRRTPATPARNPCDPARPTGEHHRLSGLHPMGLAQGRSTEAWLARRSADGRIDHLVTMGPVMTSEAIDQPVSERVAVSYCTQNSSSSASSAATRSFRSRASGRAEVTCPAVHMGRTVRPRVSACAWIRVVTGQVRDLAGRTEPLARTSHRPSLSPGASGRQHPASRSHEHEATNSELTVAQDPSVSP